MSRRTAPPARLATRIVAMFRAAENERYLWGLFGRAHPAAAHLLWGGDADAFWEDTGAFAASRALELIADDPTARRGAAVDPWAELRRLNRAFVDDRLAAAEDAARAQAEPDEDHAMRMFTADSLRPPGLEHLNGDGPYHANPGSELYRGRSRGRGRGRGRDLDPVPDPGVGDEDGAWDRGSATRSAAEATATYWGASDDEGPVRDPGDARHMRYREIPIWQRGGHRLVCPDIDETLGESPCELEGLRRRPGSMAALDGARAGERFLAGNRGLMRESGRYRAQAPHRITTGYRGPAAPAERLRGVRI